MVGLNPEESAAITVIGKDGIIIVITSKLTTISLDNKLLFIYYNFNIDNKMRNPSKLRANVVNDLLSEIDQSNYSLAIDQKSLRILITALFLLIVSYYNYSATITVLWGLVTPMLP